VKLWGHAGKYEAGVGRYIPGRPRARERAPGRCLSQLTTTPLGYRSRRPVAVHADPPAGRASPSAPSSSLPDSVHAPQPPLGAAHATPPPASPVSRSGGSTAGSAHDHTPGRYSLAHPAAAHLARTPLEACELRKLGSLSPERSCAGGTGGVSRTAAGFDGGHGGYLPPVGDGVRLDVVLGRCHELC
jgi:hypothetical protein